MARKLLTEVLKAECQRSDMPQLIVVPYPYILMVGFHLKLPIKQHDSLSMEKTMVKPMFFPFFQLSLHCTSCRCKGLDSAIRALGILTAGFGSVAKKNGNVMMQIMMYDDPTLIYQKDDLLLMTLDTLGF